MGLEYALLVWWTPSVKQEGGFPVYYYATILLSYAVHQVGPPPPALPTFSSRLSGVMLCCSTRWRSTACTWPAWPSTLR